MPSALGPCFSTFYPRCRLLLPPLRYIAYARQYVHPRLTGALGVELGRLGAALCTLCMRCVRCGLGMACHQFNTTQRAPLLACTPVCAGEAMAVLKEYFLHLRAQSAADPGSLPVTARQLESLVRAGACLSIGRHWGRGPGSARCAGHPIL